MKPKEIRREDIFFVLLLVFVAIESLTKTRGVGVSDAGNYVYAPTTFAMAAYQLRKTFMLIALALLFYLL
jgi:hypothetical protein